MYIPATTLLAATKALQKPKGVPECIRLTQTTGPYPKYLLETNDLTTLSIVPTPAINEDDTKTETARIIWPNIDQIQFNSHTVLDSLDSPAPEVTLDMQQLKILVKILKAHNVEHINIQVSSQATPAPIKFTDPQITVHLMPMTTPTTINQEE